MAEGEERMRTSCSNLQALGILQVLGERLLLEKKKKVLVAGMNQSLAHFRKREVSETNEKKIPPQELQEILEIPLELD